MYVINSCIQRNLDNGLSKIAIAWLVMKTGCSQWDLN
jgi:hypothetical protein